MSCQKYTFKSQLSSEKMYEGRVLMEEVKTDSCLILGGEEPLFSNIIA